jgi:biopolymer transport protein ExbD
LEIIQNQTSGTPIQISNVTLKEGESFPVSVSATFKDDTVKDVTAEAVWSSSSEKVAKFSNGVVKAYSSGKAIITVNYGGLTETITVEVDLASKLSINLKQVVLPKNSSVQLVLTATHSDRTTENVTQEADWKSSSEKVADVLNGLVTSYGNGKAMITATYGGKTTSVPVEINVATKIYLNKKEVSMKSGTQQILILTAVFSDGSEKEVTTDAEWSTSSYTIADVEKGKILASSYGKTTITAKYGGKSVTVKVIVDELKYLKIAEKNVTLSVNGAKQVHAVATYKDNSEKDVSVNGLWASSNESIADVKDGMITAYGKGKAKITCKFAGKTVTMQIVVN